MTSGIASVTSQGRPPHAAPCRIELAPNCSLTPRTAAYFLVATGGLTLLIALVLAFKGLWPILPFAGAEVALLVWATRHSMRQGRDRETLEISETEVTIETLRREQRETTVFPRHWAKVRLHAPQQGLHPGRLTIESHGRACEVGRFLTEDERRGLGARLKQLIGNVNESPALERAGRGRASA